MFSRMMAASNTPSVSSNPDSEAQIYRQDDVHYTMALVGPKGSGKKAFIRRLLTDRFMEGEKEVLPRQSVEPLRLDVDDRRVFVDIHYNDCK